ncbi:16513_t:CDS:2 [Funneliformis geosporum]|uniref:triacylglycerol lipase n=1 Tax=Funneliformis geosporum TaxID=1117311 RepID=A0A9W4WKF2_9GLOM|nr:6400_t:CDS:2 [Funneliformis geosporum]CAI2169444.1 16513_t:CDS:2 [Funneliformis geosporum]
MKTFKKATDPNILKHVNALDNGEITTVSLKHIFHHGSSKYPNLFRRLDVTEENLRTQELASGTSFAYDVMGVNGTGFKYEKDNAVEEFRNISMNELKSSKLDWRDIGKWLPAIKNWGTLINLAKMTYNAYIEMGQEDWYDLGEEYSTNNTFGWEEDGIRGYVFASSDNKTLIISIKGTSMGFGAGPTVPRDKENDNLLFSCCCAKVDRTWTPVCDCYKGGYSCDKTCLQDSVDGESLYYGITLNLVNSIYHEYPNSHIWLTGHSLGGALSSLMGLTYNLPVVAFESPGERKAASLLHLPHPPAIPWDKMNIYHFGHTADPIYMGSCNGFSSSCYIGGYAMETKCHAGIACTFDTVSKLKWSVNIKRHRIQEIIDNILKVWWNLFKLFPDCKNDDECEDCGLWEYIE